METTLILFGLVVICLLVLWLRGNRTRDAFDASIASLSERLDRLESIEPQQSEDDRWSFLPTGSEPESIEQATQRARQLSDDDRAAARARLREHRDDTDV